MAVLDIIGLSNSEIDWDKIWLEIETSKADLLEFFPIPNSLGFEKDAIGIIITSTKAKNITGVRKQLVNCIQLLSKYFSFTELYSGQTVSKLTIDAVCDKFLKIT